MSVLALVAAQLTLADEAMVRIATLECGGDYGTHRQVVCIGGTNAACLDAARVARSQAGSREGEQRGMAGERTIPREQATTLRDG
jgi:hypothetical protein